MGKFKEEHEFSKRLAEGTKIRAKYPDRVPVIVEVDNSNLFRSKDLPAIEKNKYLVPDITLAQFLFTLRRRMKLSEDVAVYVCINGDTIPPGSASMFAIYEQYKSEDLFVYFSILGESFFG